MAEVISISLRVCLLSDAMSSSLRLDKSLASVLSDRFGIEMMIGTVLSPSVQCVTRPMQFLSIYISLDCPYDKSSALYSVLMNFLLQGMRFGPHRVTT